MSPLDRIRIYTGGCYNGVEIQGWMTEEVSVPEALLDFVPGPETNCICCFVEPESYDDHDQDTYGTASRHRPVWSDFLNDIYVYRCPWGSAWAVALLPDLDTPNAMRVALADVIGIPVQLELECERLVAGGDG